MFYFLLLTTAYWFIFLKTTPNIYIFAPSQTTLYAAFYIVFGLMVAFRLISVLIEKAEKLKIQIFLINWEKEKAVNNSWREIFIINSLAEFCTYRTFSVFWILLVMLFFMIGLKWEQHAGEVVHTKLDQIEYFHKKNPVLLYFLSSSILLVIIIVFKSNSPLTQYWDDWLSCFGRTPSRISSITAPWPTFHFSLWRSAHLKLFTFMPTCSKKLRSHLRN